MRLMTNPLQYRPPLGTGWFALSRTLTVILALAMLFNLANGAFSLWAWLTFRRWTERPSSIDLDQAELYDSVTVVAALVLTATHLAVLVILIVWIYQAHHSDRMDPVRLEHKSGWAIGGWFVPFLNLVRPYQMVEDVRRGSRSAFGMPSNVALWWWLSVVGAAITDRVTATFLTSDAAPGEEALSALARANFSDTVASALWVAASILGILMVRSVTQLLRESPHAPQSTLGAGAPAPGMS